MATKRKHVMRRHQLTPDEVEWLTGIPQEGSSRLWTFRGGEQKVSRCRFLVENFAYLIPDGRLPDLERDIEKFSPPRPLTKLATFRH